MKTLGPSLGGKRVFTQPQFYYLRSIQITIIKWSLPFFLWDPGSLDDVVNMLQKIAFILPWRM